MDSSALKYDPSEYSQIRWAIEHNKRSYSTVKELIADFELVNELGIEINFANRLITTSQSVLSHFELESGFKSNDLPGILESLLKIPEDSKGKEIRKLLEEEAIKVEENSGEMESSVPNIEKLKELEGEQAKAAAKKSESSVQRETAESNVKTFVERQKEMAKEQATKMDSEEIITRVNGRTEETAKPKLEVIKGSGKSGIEKLVEQNTKRVETKIRGLGVTAEQASVVVEKTFKQFGPKILEQKPIINPKKEIVEITREIANPIVREKATARLTEVVTELDVKEKFERKGKSVAEDWITKIHDNENISHYTKDRLEFSRSKIEQVVINSLSGRDLQTGEIYTNTLTNEVVSILPELTETELSTVKFEAREVEKKIDILIKGNPELINIYRGEVFEEIFDRKIAESNPNLTEEQRVVANELKDFIKPFINNPVNSFGKEIVAEAGVGGENAANAARDFEYTKMTVGLITGDKKVGDVIERFELLNQRAADVNLNIEGLVDRDRLQNFFGEIKTNGLMSYFNRAQGWTNFIQKTDKFTGGFVTRIFPKLGNFLNNGVGGGFRVFAQNTFGLISKNGLGQGLKMAMSNFLGNGLKLGASAAGKALAGGSVQAAVGAAAGAATGGIATAIMAGITLLKKFLQGNLGDLASGAGKGLMFAAVGILSIPALIGAMSIGSIGLIVPAVIGGLGVNQIFTSDQVSGLVSPVGMGGGGGQEAVPTRDPNIILEPSCPTIWPVNSSGTPIPITQGPDGTVSHIGLEAIDIAVGTGTNVVAASDGVIRTGWSDGAGNVIYVDSTCEGVNISTYYGHLSSFIVSNGQKVKKGDSIGLSGNTGGHTTGAHLHYELKSDPKVDINKYLPKAVTRGCANDCGYL